MSHKTYSAWWVCHYIYLPTPSLYQRRSAQTVKAGQGIVVLEAMKMENSVTTDYAGTVKQILAHPGDNVATDAVLVEIV